ncbi:SUMO-activating enzyme subunit 1 [Schistocerca nitens]|uniref:SUMO-activating enzyme subunit 1 n=1 Tax=Schistocerca nitens TaxID=7011 RepID=UPI00211988E4|nr:SUMO-activating enzyme subunit 1 [Schistocerca nitens]
MVHTAHPELTEDEVELYDRQIRLWGLESQKRLRNAKVLLIGLRGFGAEVCKNVVLAGVRSITLLDDGNLAEDEWAQFLAPRDAVGKNRAESSLTRVKGLNPMVEVIADTEAVSAKQDAYFTQFDVVVVTDLRPWSEALRINAACRLAGVKFLCGGVWGCFGFTFADLLLHEYAEDVIQHSAEKKKGEQTKLTVKNTAEFVPFRDALEVDWRSEQYSNKLSKMDCCYFLMKVLMKFCDEKGRELNPSKREEEIAELKSLASEELKKLGVRDDMIPDKMFGCLFSQVSPVCAIVGGVMAQEVIKTVSQKEQPHNNMFFFNPLNNLGYVACLGN